MASEFGLVAVERATVEQTAEEGNKRAKSTLKALQTLSFQLSGAQLGITVTSLLVGFLTEPALSPALEPLVGLLPVGEARAAQLSTGLALALATGISMVLGELVPKNLAIARPLQVAFSVATPFRLVNALFKPVIVLLNGTADWTVRRLGIEPTGELSAVRSLDELELLIKSAAREGVLLKEEFSLLRRSVSFASKTAADALVPRTSVAGIARRSSVKDMKALALRTGHSRFPVYEENLDKIVGVVHVKDSYRLPAEARDRTGIEAIMQDVLAVPESRDLGSLLLEMRRLRRHLAVVIDEYGGTAGIVTIEDLVEEVVGEIEDEHDPEAAVVHVTPPLQGTTLLSGLLHPDEVFEACGLEIPTGSYETLAGFLLSLFDRIPQPGDHISYAGWELKVVEMERNRIAKVLLVAPGSPPTPEDAP